MNSKINSFSAPGKIILFGEHSVVYGYPAIAIAIDKRARTIISSENEDKRGFLHVPDLYPNNFFPFIKKENMPRDIAAHLKIIKYFTDSSPSKKLPYISITSDIPISAGLGSSAAVIVSLTKALSYYYDTYTSLDEINHIAFKGEIIQHKTPSGIDNTIATYGGGIYYHNGKIVNISVPSSSFYITVANSMVKRNTKDLVLKVRQKYEKDKETVQSLFIQIDTIVKEALKAIKEKDIAHLGELMNQNQKILDKLGVGHPEISKIIKIFKQSNSLGAKLTGAGGGGCVIGLFHKKEDAIKAVNRSRENNYQSFLTLSTNIGVKKDE